MGNYKMSNILKTADRRAKLSKRWDSGLVFNVDRVLLTIKFKVIFEVVRCMSEFFDFDNLGF